MDVSRIIAAVPHWFFGLATWKQILLTFATAVFLIELLLRNVAAGTPLYKKWTAFFEGIGVFWTAIILSFVYVLSVGPIGLFMRLAGRDLLDRGMAKEPTFWRAYEPNPLGPAAAVRHQF